MADTGVEAAEAVGESTENIPEIELIIKASTVDGRRKGACLFCQVKKVNMYILKNIFLRRTTQ